MRNCLRIAVMLTLSACSLSSALGQTPWETALQSTGLESRWSAQAVLNTARDSIRHVMNDEELIYVQSSAGVVTTFNAENGRRMWASQIGRNDDYAMGAVTNRDTLLILSGPNVYGLNKFTGDELFVYRLPAQPSSMPGMDENSFFVPVVGGSLCAYSLKTLAYQERYGKLPPGVARPMAWRYFTGEQMHFPPVVGAETIGVSTTTGSVHAINLSGVNSGKALFQLFLRSPTSTPLCYVNQNGEEWLISTTTANRVFCMSLASGGRMAWTRPTQRTVTEKVAVVDGAAFVVTQGDGLVALSVETGLPLNADGKEWHVPEIVSVAAVSENRVYAIDQYSRMVVLDKATATAVGRVPVSEFTHRLRNDLTDRVYLGTASGRIVCLAEKGSDFATYHQMPDRQPVMPDVPATDAAPAAAADNTATP